MVCGLWGDGLVSWEIVTISGGTYTPATDWGTQFDDTTATGYMVSMVGAAQGELHLPSPFPFLGLLQSPNLHYWQPAITNAGVVSWTDIGTTVGIATYGRRARLQFMLENPASIPFTISNPGASTMSLQVVLNGEVVGEYAAATAGTLSAVRGKNLVQLVAPVGGVEFYASFVSGSTTGKAPGTAGSFSSAPPLH